MPRTPDDFIVLSASVPFIFLFYLFYDLAYTPMLVTYTLEILPYAIRAKGFALMVCYISIVLAPSLLTYRPKKNLMVSLAMAFNQTVDPWAFSVIGWKYVSLSPLVPQNILVL
jgi:hypothetical protein